MDTQSAIDVIAQIPIGIFIAWIGVIIGVITGASAVTVKLYKVFTKYKEKADASEEQKREIKEHADTLKEINESLTSIKSALEEQRDVNLKQTRYSIVCTCDKALSEGKISAGALRSMMDLYGEYTGVFHGNGYVKVLVDKVLLLPVEGRLE